MAGSDTSDECAQFLNAPGFHQRFSLPATPERDALNISYSDLGRQPTGSQPNSPPVLLFMPGMLASRFQAVLLHTVGAKMGVRVLTIDRFGIGQSTDVPIAQRISTWVEVVPKLLAHLDIPHVALASHSAGTIYLLNTLYSCRQILSPTRPYAVLMAPFVDIKHSGVKLLQAAQLLPSTVLGCFDSVAKSLDTYVGPIIGSSLSFMNSWFPSAAEPEPAAVARLLRWQSEYGMPNDFLDAILQAAVRAGMAESTKGLNDETRLCLKKSVTWGECEDFDEYVKKLAVREEQRAEGSRLRVKILFAQQDSMIGQRGRQYMEECWERNCRTETGQVFDVLAKTVDDTDHDGVPGRLTVLEEILGDVLGEVKVAEVGPWFGIMQPS